MKFKLLFLAFTFTAISSQAQSIKNQLGAGGNFLVLDKLANVKLLISELGEVNWYLDGQDMFIRESNFEYESGKFGTYDFIHIDGANGRIGFNTLSNTTGGLDDNLPLTSSVSLFGSIATRVRVLDGTNSYSIKQDDHTMIIDMSGALGDATMALPLVVDSKGRQYIFKRNGFKTHKTIIIPQTGQLLNGEVNGEIILTNDNAAVTLVCDGTGWWSLTELGATAGIQVINASTTAANVKAIEVNFTSANQEIDLSLPDASTDEGKIYEIKRNADGALFTGNVLNIVPSGGDNVDGQLAANPYKLYNNWQAVTIYSNGSRWLVADDYKPNIAGITTTAVAYSLTAEDATLLVSAAVTITLPDVAKVPNGKVFIIRNRIGGGGGIVTVNSTGGQFIDDGVSTSFIIAKDYIVTLQSDGTQWFIILYSKP